MSDLRKLAEQAMEYLADYTVGESPNASAVNDLIADLDAALAQPEPEPLMQDGIEDRETRGLSQWLSTRVDDYRAWRPEPEPVAYTDDVTRIMREAGMTFHLGLPHKAVIEQMTRVVDLVCAEASIKAAQKFAVALAQPEPVAYPEGDVVGPCVCGSWPGGKCLKCPRIASPQRKPLTEQEIMQRFHDKVDAPVDVSDAEMIEFARAIEAAHGIGGEHE